MTPQIEKLRGHCHQLRLYQVEAELAALSQLYSKHLILWKELQ